MRYLIIILILFVSLGVKSQQRFPSGFPTQANQGWNKWGYGMTDSGLIVANRDTNWLAKYSGTVVFKPSNKKFYWFDSTNLTWNQFADALDTTSLSNRINLKLNITDTTSKWWGIGKRWVDTVYRVNDSTIGFTINGGAQQTFEIKGGAAGGGGSGTVTSVALSMPSAFTVTGSPITSSGTFAVSGAGTTLQYIRGNGTLATTDTGMIPNFYLKARGLISGTSPITFNQFTGAIGINNANTSGTKGAASFTAAFSDNGSGLIDLADLVAAGSCTGCILNINSKGNITGYSDGPSGATNNVNIGAGFRPVNAITQEMRTYFAGFGQRLDSVSNTNGLTWAADTTRSSGLPTYFYVDSLASIVADTVYANNGLSNNADSVQFGQSVGASGNPAALHNGREVPLNGFGIGLSGTGSLGIGTSSPSLSYRLSIIASGSTAGISLSTATGTGINANSTNSTIVALSSGGTAISGSTSAGAGGYGVQGSGGIGGIGGRFYTIAAGGDASPVALELERQPTGVGVTNGAGFTIMFRNAFTNGVSGNESGRITNYFSNAVSGLQSSAFGFYLVNNAVSARKALLASTGQWTWDGYTSLTAQTDTTTYKPIAIDMSGNVVKMAAWVGGSSGGAVTLNNIGSGYRWVATSAGNIKTVYNSNTILWDSTSNTNGLTAKVDTSVIATQYDLTQIPVPSLQSVTDVGNTTTNDIINGSRINSVGRFSVEKTYTTLNQHSFDDYSTLSPSVGGTDGFSSFDASTTLGGSVNTDHYIAYQSRLRYTSSGNLTGEYGMTGLYIYNQHTGTGTLPVVHGIYIRNVGIGGGPIDTAYGIRIRPVTVGTENYGIRSEGGKNSFVDEVMIGGHTTPIAKLDVRSSTYDQTMYCDNTKAGGYSAIFNSSNGSGGNIGLDITASGGSGNKAINIGPAMTSSDFGYYSNGNAKAYIAGKVGIGSGVTSPTAYLHIAAGTATANTAPLKINAGTNLTTPEDGAIEYNGTHFYATIGSTRYQLDQQGGGGTTIYTGDGILASDRNVASGGFTLRVDGANNSDTIMSVTNTGTSGIGLYALGSLKGADIQSTNLGLFVFGTAQGMQTKSTNGEGILAQSDAIRAGKFITNLSTTNTVDEVLNLQRAVQSGVGAAGIGAAITLSAENTSGAQVTTAQWVGKFTTATAGAEVSEISMIGVNNSATNTVLKIGGDGALTTYGKRIMSVVTSGAGTLTLGNSENYVFTGTTTTWTLPAVSGTSGVIYYIKNRGVGAITLNANAGANEIFDLAAVNTISVDSGGSVILISDGTYFNTL